MHLHCSSWGTHRGLQRNRHPKCVCKQFMPSDGNEQRLSTRSGRACLEGVASPQRCGCRRVAQRAQQLLVPAQQAQQAHQPPGSEPAPWRHHAAGMQAAHRQCAGRPRLTAGGSLEPQACRACCPCPPHLAHSSGVSCTPAWPPPNSLFSRSSPSSGGRLKASSPAAVLTCAVWPQQQLAVDAGVTRSPRPLGHWHANTAWHV